MTAALGLAGGVAAIEPLEDLRQLLRGDARPRVGQGQGAAAGLALHADGDGAALGGVLDGIVAQDAHDLFDHAPIGLHHAVVGGGEDEGVLRGDHDGLLVQLADHVQHVEAGHLHHQCLLVMPGQEQQTLHQFLHAGGLLGNGVDALVQDGLVILAPAAEHVHIPLNHRDGRAQLMAGVGDELLLAVVAALNAVQHGVDDRGQLLQFVLHARHVDAVAQVAGGEGGGHVRDIPDGGQHALVQAAVLAQEVDHPQKIHHHQRGHQARPDNKGVRQVIDDVQPHAGGVGDDDSGAGWIQGKAEVKIAVVVAGRR